MGGRELSGVKRILAKPEAGGSIVCARGKQIGCLLLVCFEILNNQLTVTSRVPNDRAYAYGKCHARILKKFHPSTFLLEIKKPATRQSDPAMVGLS